MQAIHLGVNIDHVATLRQARMTRYPDPVQAAMLAESGGADSITIYLREDRRHIQDRDVLLLKDTLQTPMNLELAMTDEMLAFAERLQPEYCCLVPERRAELTTEGGLDAAGLSGRTGAACRRLQAAGIRVSLFVDPERAQLEAARDAGAAAVELHTGRYADAAGDAQRDAELQQIAAAVELGCGLGLQVHAGHGLHYRNVTAVAAIAGIRELNIGHSIIARALYTGLEAAVREMKQLLLRARA